jgi:hypothetical protein
MIEYTSLENENISSIYRAFIDAFSEYEVNMELPIENLEEIMLPIR